MTSSTKRSAETIVHTVEVGSIVVDVCRGTSNDGHTYLYYEDSRKWQPRSGSRCNYSQRFYARNGKDHQQAIKQATEWMDKNAEAADPDWTPKVQLVQAA